MNLEAALGVALGFLLGIVGHEFVTHLAGARSGDPAPRFQGRISFDLRKHADPLGTYVAPALFVIVRLLGSSYPFAFGYGKSHALAPSYQRGSVVRSVIVPLTGPLTTLILAAVVGRLASSGPTSTVVFAAAETLLFLTAIELLPIPGRDGGRVLARFLPPHAAMKMEELKQYEGVFLIGIFLIFPEAVLTIARILADIAFA